MSRLAWLGILFGCILGGSHVSAAVPMDSMPEPGLYVNSEGSPLLPLLKNAKDYIDIEIYTIGNQTVRDLLREAISRRVKIRIIKEPKPVGERCILFEKVTDEDKISKSCQDQRQ